MYVVCDALTKTVCHLTQSVVIEGRDGLFGGFYLIDQRKQSLHVGGSLIAKDRGEDLVNEIKHYGRD
jgi:hypothetical protein